MQWPKGSSLVPNQVHVSYVHTPMRYAWDLQHQYLRESRLVSGPKSAAARALLHYLRMWDVRTSHGVDYFVANSSFIARRIRKAYGRDSEVIYPPVDVDIAMKISDDSGAEEPFYLSASRLVP